MRALALAICLVPAAAGAQAVDLTRPDPVTDALAEWIASSARASRIAAIEAP